MGVPAFFRWLSKKYPSIVVHCVEETSKEKDEEGETVVDLTQPNPNNIEFDNLYLDMNGIIHPCTHPEDKPAPSSEAEMLIAIFEYIDRIMSMVRPRKLLYMAIDGVAPRAKMNQQRSRRFRAAQDSAIKKAAMARLREELMLQGRKLPPEKPDKERFDSNCITPGTPFMSRLADALRFYIHYKLHTDSGWKDLQVILSDANVPGEGEHKIMDFIRKQRGMPDHDSNTKHCLCGADADLIMLGLATHEPHFTIIREEFKPNQPKPCPLCEQMGHEMEDCVGIVDSSEPDPIISSTSFIFIRLDVLREYLERDLRMDGLPYPYDFERAIDDWVVMCFFVGNDFLPHLPSLEIREGAIDRLIKLYRSSAYQLGGWLTDSGVVNLPRLQLILQELADVEDEIFRRRRKNDVEAQSRFNQQRQATKRRHPANSQPHYLAPPKVPRGVCTSSSLGNYSAARNLKQMLLEKSDSSDVESSVRRTNSENEVVKLEEEPEDKVRLWEDGWRERYYHSKFGVDINKNPEFPQLIAYHYVRGIAWVLAYYYQGCVAWDWYFPYHYAPFARDFTRIDSVHVGFKNYPCQPGRELFPPSEPFRPMEQLMAVFPADSRKHVPSGWRDLMTDPLSPIIDFYPTDFKVDLNGKRYLWQGVALLPLVNQKRLLKVLNARRHLLTEDELYRDRRSCDSYFVRSTHQVSKSIMQLRQDPRTTIFDNIDPKLTKGISGRFRALSDNRAKKWACNEIIRSPFASCEELNSRYTRHIHSCQVVQVDFWDPHYNVDHKFKATLRLDVRLPVPTLKPRSYDSREGGYGQNNNSYQTQQQWRPVIGFGSGRCGGGGGYRPPQQYDPRVGIQMMRNCLGNNPVYSGYNGYRAEGGHIFYGESTDMPNHSYSDRQRWAPPPQQPYQTGYGRPNYSRQNDRYGHRDPYRRY